MRSATYNRQAHKNNKKERKNNGQDRDLMAFELLMALSMEPERCQLLMALSREPERCNKGIKGDKGTYMNTIRKHKTT